MRFADLKKLKVFDAFSKTKSNVRVKTQEGAILSLVAISIMTILMVTELITFMQGELTAELLVDTSLGASIKINIDITFHALPCAFISVNAMDKSGNHQLNIHHNIVNTRLTHDGAPVLGQLLEQEVVGGDKHEIEVDIQEKPPCGNCYGADSLQRKCCDTCDEVADAYREKGWAFSDPNRIQQCVKEKYLEHLQEQKDEGCKVQGFLTVSRVAGNFNILPGKFIVQNSRYVVDSKLYHHEIGVFNTSHTVHHLSFGDSYPGMHNPLDGESRIWLDKETSPMYEYFVKIVPTIFEESSSRLETNQFSVMEYVQTIGRSRMEHGVSGFFVLYDLSPISVYYTYSASSFLHFLTNLCAIVGGVYTVFSLIDSFFYSGLSTIKEKLTRKES